MTPLRIAIIVTSVLVWSITGQDFIVVMGLADMVWLPFLLSACLLLSPDGDCADHTAGLYTAATGSTGATTKQLLVLLSEPGWLLSLCQELSGRLAASSATTTGTIMRRDQTWLRREVHATNE